MAAASPAPNQPQATKFIHPKANADGGPNQHKINVGHGCVLHPYCNILATQGPISIGEYCILAEYSKIENILPPGPDGKPQTLVIGNYNTFAPHAVCNSRKVGDGNKFEAYSSTGVMSVVGKGCALQPHTRVTHDVVVPDQTTVFGSNSTWIHREKEEFDENQQHVLGQTRWFRKYLSTK